MSTHTRSPWRVGLLTAALLLTLGSCSSDGGAGLRAITMPHTSPSASRPPAPPLTKYAYLHPDGDYFGVSTYHAPDPDATDAVTAAAGRHPTILEYFQSWAQDFDPADVESSYAQGALPLLTWQPDGGSTEADQPDYSLSRIASGDFDAYVIKFATAVKDQRRPVILRFAHEMNGTWYPWSEATNGNRPGEYVAAWRHVHDLFSAVGATNVIWLWSPNVIRGTPDADLSEFYPGDQYVDWMGVDAYGFGERTAAEVLDPTTRILYEISRKPLLIAETGSAPGPQQASWTADLFRWIERNPRTIGFVWFQHSKDQGGQHDYRFDVSPTTRTAFQQGLASLHLRRWPVPTTATATATPKPTSPATASGKRS